MQISQHYNINFTLNGKPLKIWKIPMNLLKQMQMCGTNTKDSNSKNVELLVMENYKYYEIVLQYWQFWWWWWYCQGILQTSGTSRWRTISFWGDCPAILQRGECECILEASALLTPTPSSSKETALLCRHSCTKMKTIKGEVSQSKVDVEGLVAVHCTHGLNR